jgi:hypothetical protein
MNELQKAIRQSFETVKRVYPSFMDPDGIYHEESVSYITPYTEGMEELAEKCGLSRSQLYRKLADHKAKFKPHELEELHKQLHWHDHRDFMGDLMVDIEATKQIITHSRRQQAMDEALEDFDGDKNPAGAFGSSTRQSDLEEIDRLNGVIVEQKAMIDRLLTLTESQQALLTNLSNYDLS